MRSGPTTDGEHRFDVLFNQLVEHVENIHAITHVLVGKINKARKEFFVRIGQRDGVDIGGRNAISTPISFD